MIYCLDTNAVSDLIREVDAVKKRTAVESTRARILLNPIVIAEVRFGLDRLPEGTRRTNLAIRVDAVLGTFESIPVDDHTIAHYVRIRLSREASGGPMSDNDLWIAATASSLGATLVTRDQDFQGIPGLLVEDWSVPSPGTAAPHPVLDRAEQ
jgi:predicted nucleic acid-binding protein